MREPLPTVLIPGLLCTPRLYAEQIHALWRFGPVTVANHTHDDSMAGIARRILAHAPPRFTLIGATTRSGLLSAPLLSRFPLRERVDYYTAEQLQHIVSRSARLLQIQIDDAGAFEIARRSRGTPRIANNLLRRVRDYAQVRGDGQISSDVADRALRSRCRQWR